MKDKLITATKEICDRLIAENGGLVPGDLNQVVTLVKGLEPTAQTQDIVDIFKSKITD